MTVPTDVTKKIISGLFLIVIVISAGDASQGRSDMSAFEIENEARKKSMVWSETSIRNAIVTFSAAADAWSHEGDRPRAAASLRESAKLAQILSEYELGFSALEKAIELDRLENRVAGLAVSAGLRSLMSAQRGNKTESEAAYLQAVDLASQTEDDEAKAYALFSAGMYNFYNGDLKTTLTFFEQSLPHALKTNDTPLIVQVRSYIGFSFIRLGEPLIGAESMKAALDESERTGYIRERALALFGVGFVSMQMGRKQDALVSFRQAEAIFPVDFEWLERGKLYTSIAVVYEELGSFDLATMYCQKGFDYYGKADYPFGQLAILPSLASLVYRNGDRETALRLYDEASAMANRMDAKFQLAVINEALGNIAFEERSFSEAIRKYEKSAHFYDSINVKLPRLDRSLGRAFDALGETGSARKYFEASLTINRVSRDTLSTAEILFDLAKLDLKDKDFFAAFEHISESLRLTENSVSGVLNQKLQMSFFSTVQDRYKFYVALLMEKHLTNSKINFANEALNAAERSRSRYLLESLVLSEANFTADADPVTVEKEKKIRISLNAKSDNLTEHLGGKMVKADVDKLSAEIDDLHNQLEDIKGKIKEKSPIYSAIKNPEPFDVADFQANVLDDESLLLEFSFGAEESYLWVVSKGEVNAYYLPARDKIESRIERLRGLLGGHEILAGETLENYQKRIADADAEYLIEARRLSSDLLGQAADKIKDKRLIVVADGRLHYFPLASLPMPNSESDEPILLTNEVVYEPSASALKIFRMETKAENQPSKDLLVFADPVFSKTDERLTGLDAANTGFVSTILGSFRSVGSLDALPRLPASEQEAKSISDVVGANQTTVRSGFAANRESVLNSDITDYKILHFATHGLIDEKRPELSGILLSLFDKDGKPQDGGFIRLQDVYGLNLKADLVVLSACDTGIGKEVKGEGVMSLNNAFLQAGAKSVVSSLWKVDDNATKELMTEFYRGIASDGLTASAALRKAQIKMYNDPRYRSPFFWAAFTAQGDYQRVPQISRGFNSWIYLAGLFPLLLYGIYRLRRRKNF